VRPEVTAKISSAVDDLDSTIRDIRRAIFELRAPVAAPLRTEIRDLIDAAAVTLRFRPRLDLRGPVDRAVPHHLHPDLLAVLQEALSNAARHADASGVDVAVTVVDDRLTVTVADDGVGIAGHTPRGGLVNLRERAERHGGELLVTAGEPHGTALRWSVPLRPHRHHAPEPFAGGLSHIRHGAESAQGAVSPAGDQRQPVMRGSSSPCSRV
jgi:signal transduction histidine kinase